MLATTQAAAVWPQQATSLVVCHAGSLQGAFSTVEREFASRYPHVRVTKVPGGSVALAARLAAGLQPCDVFGAADYQDIDLLLKPSGVAPYTIVFAKGRMVLAYLDGDPNARGIAEAGEFNPPSQIPMVAAGWFRLLLEPGVRISGSHPFLDPAGYRAHMMFQLTQAFYDMPNLANQLLEHYTILPDVGGANGGGRGTLGTDFTFQFIYEHSAAAAARDNPAYRYVTLPPQIDLSSAAYDDAYARAAVTLPALGFPGVRTPVTIRGARVAWGLTIPRSSQNLDQAIDFVRLLLEAPGTSALNAAGLRPIAPAYVAHRDYARVPAALQSLVRRRSDIP
jgi:molybdate/tungstate transport system substrate-binding protein